MFLTAGLAGLPNTGTETSLGAFRRALEGTLASAGAQARLVEPDALLSLAAEWVSPAVTSRGDSAAKAVRRQRRWSPRDPLHAQCATPGRALAVATTRWRGAVLCTAILLRRAALLPTAGVPTAGVLAAGLVGAALLPGATPARADVLSEMQRFWDGAAVNTTGPTAFEGQASGHWTLGNLYLRAPVRSERIATVSLPSFRAGCGGIDAFAGAFSFVDSDQLVAFARGIAQNATGFAFELALETISPVIAETMSKLRALANWVNNQSIDSCEMAQSLVGAAWSTNDRASAAICAAIGTSQGIFSDYAAARHGCGAGGQRNSTLAAATGELEDVVPVNVNYAWRAVQESTFLGSDTELGEFAIGLDPLSWTPEPYDERSPRCQRRENLTRLSFASKWSRWFEPAVRRRSCRGSSSPRRSRSVTGWRKPTATRASARMG